MQTPELAALDDNHDDVVSWRRAKNKHLIAVLFTFGLLFFRPFPAPSWLTHFSTTVVFLPFILLGARRAERRRVQWTLSPFGPGCCPSCWPICVFFPCFFSSTPYLCTLLAMLVCLLARPLCLTFSLFACVVTAVCTPTRTRRTSDAMLQPKTIMMLNADDDGFPIYWLYNVPLRDTGQTIAFHANCGHEYVQSGVWTKSIEKYRLAINRNVSHSNLLGICLGNFIWFFKRTFSSTHLTGWTRLSSGYYFRLLCRWSYGWIPSQSLLSKLAFFTINVQL